jgi:hypothetical protein
MNIFINGCSHTEGTKIALDNDLTKAWPFKLQKRLNCEVTSIARAGCSNDRIVRTTIESIATSVIPPTHAIIQFTQANRFEIPDPHPDNEWEQILPTTYLKYKNLSFDPTLKNLAERNFSGMVKHGTSIVLDRKLLTQIACLQNLFEVYDIDYSFIIWYDVHEGIFGDKLWKLLDKNRILNYYNGDFVPMHYILNSHGFKLSQKMRPEGVRDLHYQEDAQEWIAQKIMQYYMDGSKMRASGHLDYKYGDAEDVTNFYV